MRAWLGVAAAAAAAAAALVGCKKNDPRRTTARAELARCLAKLDPPEAAGSGERVLVLDVAALVAACPILEGVDAPALGKAIAKGITADERAKALAVTSFRCVDAEAALAGEPAGPDLRGKRLRAYAERCGARRYGLAELSAGPFVGEEVYVAGRWGERLTELASLARDRQLTADVNALRARLRLLLPLPALGVFEALPPSPEASGPVVGLPGADRGGIVLTVAPAAVTVTVWPELELTPTGKWQAVPALEAWPYPGQAIEGSAGEPHEWQQALAGAVGRARDDLMADDPRYRAVAAPVAVIASGDTAMVRVAAALDAADPARGSSVVFTLARAGERVEVPVRAVGRVDDSRSGPTMMVSAAAVELLEEHSRVTLRRVPLSDGERFARELADELGVWRKVQETRLRVRVRPDTPYRVFALALSLARRVWGEEVFYAGLAAGPAPVARPAPVQVTLEGVPAKATRLEVAELRRAAPGLGACFRGAGRWEIRLVAEPDGRVRDGGLVGSGDNDEVEGCVAQTVRGWKLPASAGRRTLHLAVVAAP